MTLSGLGNLSTRTEKILAWLYIIIGLLLMLFLLTEIVVGPIERMTLSGLGNLSTRTEKY